MTSRSRPQGRRWKRRDWPSWSA
uniref:Uncharacterized protein n=1 Tax=Arundo donax TaxID=35708 RepID=A0A0A8ZXX1_ARUDO